MKRWTVILMACGLLLVAGCGKRSEVPELHPIPYPAEYATAQDEYGADAFGNMLDHPTSRYFLINDYYNMKSEGTLHLLEHFETYQQTTEYTCGSAAALMVLHHWGVDDYDEMELAEQMHIDTTHGTAVEEVRDFFLRLDWQVESHASTDFFFDSTETFADYVKENIDAGVPILVDWADWAGHWQVIIGIDTLSPDSVYDDVLILADPYDITDHYQDGYYIYPLGRFMSMWYEGPCTANDEPYQQPFVTVCPAQNLK